MSQDDLTIILEEAGDCMEDMARSVDRLRMVHKRMFRAIQELTRDHEATEKRVQRLEDQQAAARLQEPQ